MPSISFKKDLESCDARDHNEPAGQIGSRRLEIVMIKGALQRAEELTQSGYLPDQGR